MKRLDPATWRVISPLFDRALDLDADARRQFLDEVAATDAVAGKLLTHLLGSHERLLGSNFLDTPALEDAEPDLAGSTIGAYTLDAPLGAGGMGAVWKAHRSDGRYEGAVALKLLQLAVLERHTEATFTLEGTLLARLSHPNIARLLDAGVTAAGQPYLVLEYVEGTRLDTFADAQRLDVAGRLALLLQVCDAVAHAHAHLVVHRDLKPSNVLVDREGRVKLLDFGIGSWLDNDAIRPAPHGVRTFTPEYAAPEQRHGGAITTATDVYALGVLAYVLLTGRHPLPPPPVDPLRTPPAGVEPDPPRMSVRAADEEPGPAGTPSAIADVRGTTPGRLQRALGGDLDLIVATALKHDPRERYRSVPALADDLRRVLAHEPVSVRGFAATYRFGRFVRRNRVAVGLGAAALVALVAGAAGIWAQSVRAAAERDFALRQLARAESVNDMNAFLLSDAAPLGQSFTAGSLLASAEELLNRHPVEPADETTVESLISIGRQYWSQDEDDNARRALTRAYDLSRALPLASASTRAKAACALGSALARGNDLGRARALVGEGLAGIPPDRPFLLDRVFCELRASEVAREAGEGASDIAHSQSADTLLRESGLGSELAKLNVAAHLAEAFRAAGRNAEASAAFESAFVRLSAMGRDRTEMAGTLLNNWALSRYLLGQPREAERLFRRAVEIGSADASGASVSPMLLNNLARPILEQGRASEALVVAEQAAAEATRLGDNVVLVQSMLLRATAYRETGDYARAGELLARFERLQAERLPAGHIAFAALASEQAMLAEARGDLVGAAAAADRAVAIAAGSSQGRELLARGLLRRANLSLVQGRVDDAVADAGRGLALELERAEAESPSSILGRAYFTWGQALQAARRPDEARAALTQALRHFESALGPDNRDTNSARDLLGRLE